MTPPVRPRIAHVFPSFGTGGVELRMCSVMRILGPRFHHVITALHDNFQAAPHLPDDGSAELAARPRGHHCTALAFRAWFRELKPDVVMTYNWGSIEAALGARLAGLPHLHQEAGFGSDEATTLKRRRVWTRRLLLRHSYATVMPSHTLERIALEQYKLPRNRVRRIVNGVDTERFQPHPDRSWRHAQAVADDEILFGFVGRLSQEKSLATLLGAMARASTPGFRVALAGDGPERENLARLAASLGLQDRLLFAGALADPRPFLHSLDGFVLSSITEQMPMSLLEAMACGLPAVATNVGDCAEMLDAGSPPELVPPRDETALAAALSALAADASLRARLGAKNLARCRAHYDLRRMAEQYAALFHEAAASHGRVGAHPA